MSQTLDESQRPRCVQCGTRRMRIRSGLLVCRHGHVQQFFRVEHAADEEFSSATANISRRRRKQRKAKRKRRAVPSQRSGLPSDTESEPYGEGYNSDFTEPEPAEASWYPGIGGYTLARGNFLRLQCLQLLFRMQVEAMAKEWPLPDVWEQVAKEVWTMFVASLPASYHSPQPLIAATEDWKIRFENQDQTKAQTYDAVQELEQEKEELKQIARQRRNKRRRRKTAGEESDWTSDGAGWTQDEATTQAEDDLDDPEERLAALDPVFAQQRADRLSQQEPTVEPETQDEQPEPKRSNDVATKLKTLLQLGTLPSTLSIIYLSLVKLQIPVLWKDLLDLVAQHRLPYLEVHASLPASLVQYLNSSDLLYAGLDCPNLPTITSLQERTCTLARLFQIKYAVTFPELNASLMTWRLVNAMALPARFYVGTKRLLSFLGFCFHLHAEGKVLRFDGVRFMGLIPREAVVMATLLVLLKMEVGANPEPEWLAALEAEQLEPDVIDMDDAQIDDYLDFAERSLIKQSNPVILNWRQIQHPRDWLAFLDNIDTTPEKTPPRPKPVRHILQSEQQAVPLYPMFHQREDRDGTLPMNYERMIEIANTVLGITSKEHRYPDDPVERKTRLVDELERGSGIQNLVERVEEMLLAECVRRQRGREKLHEAKS